MAKDHGVDQQKTYLDENVEDTGLAKEDISKMIYDRDIWRQAVSSVRSRTMRR